MTAQSFGRRGLTPADSASHVLPARIAAAASMAWQEPVSDRTGDFDASWSEAFDLIPVATLGLILFFVLAYGVEWKLAVGTNKDGSFDHTSLVGFGAASFDRVIGAGEWWRVFLAPLLHASVSHQVGNCVALFFVGFRLEAMVGRYWLLGLFALSAIGGLVGSMLGNPHAVVTVGASGAITGLIGALFVVSFHHRAGGDRDQRAMRRTALFFGVPALLPLAFGASGHVDYFAHGGGALTGAVLALVACLVWPSLQRKPSLAAPMGLVGLVFFGLAGVGCLCAASHFGNARAEFSGFIPSNEIPAVEAVNEKIATDLLQRYPHDPRSHFLHGLLFVHANRLSAADYELRAALDLIRDDNMFGDLRDRVGIVLALVVDGEGRHIDAKAMMGPHCGSPITRTLAQEAQKMIAKICS